MKIFREALLSAVAQLVPSLITVLLVAGVCVSVVLTTGKAAGNQQEVLASIDSAGARSIIIRSTADAQLDSDVIHSFSSVLEIESAIALGTATDVKNGLLPDGAVVPLRDFWGMGVEPVGEGQALASELALKQLGMRQPVGFVSNEDGLDVSIVGKIDDPSFLPEYEPLLLTPRAKSEHGEVGIIVVVVTKAEAVAPVLEVIRPMLTVEGSGPPVIETSSALNSLRGEIEGKLGSFSSTLSIGALLLASSLVSIVQVALVLLRRKDWGRRRALGASRSLVMSLILLQTGVLAFVGASLGVFASVTALAAFGDPIPGWSFIGATVILACSASIIAAVIPAVIASKRDPIRELRVP